MQAELEIARICKSRSRGVTKSPRIHCGKEALPYRRARLPSSGSSVSSCELFSSAGRHATCSLGPRSGSSKER